ncbi:MAG: hypothetical protein E7055_07120 [Lentisphaerae bacterium]|nr:hypothetical protein [Lentisphaerota bacterium]
MKKLIVKPDWRVMRKRFILVCMIPFLVTALILIACIFSRRTEIQAAPFELSLFSLVIDFFLIGLFYLIFISIRITFDGKKLIRYKFFLPVRKIPVDQIDTANYDSARKILLVYCRRKNSLYWFPCNLFAEKDLDGLLEILAREHGIKTMKN